MASNDPQGIEAGTAETGTGSVNESPVGAADAPKPFVSNLMTPSDIPMREKMARAIDPYQWKAFDTGRLCTSLRKEDLSSWAQASAALAAMLPPTQGMIAAGRKCDEAIDAGLVDFEVEEIFTAMITEAGRS